MKMEKITETQQQLVPTGSLLQPSSEQSSKPQQAAVSTSNQRKENSLVKNFFGGAFGGVCLVFAGHPLDTIKVRLQTQPYTADNKPTLYKGTWDCFKKTVRQDGFRGLYKGMATPIAGVAPMYAICFWAFTAGKDLQKKSENHEFTLGEIFAAGGLAGLATTSILGPGERIKCLLQIQSSNPAAAQGRPKYNGAMDCAKQLYKQGGIRNVYVGTLATACRDIPSTATYFMTYEYFQRILTPEGQSRDQLSAGRTLIAGGMAGLANWVVAIPADVLKSRQQTAPEGKYKGLLDVLRKTIQLEGYKGLYKGATPIILRAFPANAACFLGYESAMKFLNFLFPDS